MARRGKNLEKQSTQPSTFLVETLEQRMLFSADLPMVMDGLTGVDPNAARIVNVVETASIDANEAAVTPGVQEPMEKSR